VQQVGADKVIERQLQLSLADVGDEVQQCMRELTPNHGTNRRQLTCWAEPIEARHQ
jgi:hypothetical protein